MALGHPLGHWATPGVGLRDLPNARLTNAARRVVIRAARSNKNVLKHGRYTADAIARRRRDPPSADNELDPPSLEND
jgi:hypothetical protein